MTHLKRIILSCAVALCAAPALAGPLALDTNSVGGVWHGSSLPYQGYFDYPGTTQPSGLQGYIEWAVYAPGAFPGGFTASFAVEPGDYVYAYQIYETGPLPVSFMGVTLQTTADSIGEFTGNDGFGLVAGASTLASQLTLTQAQWFFDENGVAQGTTSTGLLFTSPYGPQLLEGNTVDGGSSATAIPLPSPLPPNVPEPGTLVLASFGLVAMGVQLLRRRLRRSRV